MNQVAVNSEHKSSKIMHFSETDLIHFN